MQGIYVGDEDTPPECLRRDLADDFKTRVSILNTGHLGYSPEQYFYTLLAYADRFRPHFVIVSLFANDFGELQQVIKGNADWEEARYWLDEITHFCRRRDITHLFVPIPTEPLMLGRRRPGFYPGAIANIMEANSITLLDPTDEFISTHLELMLAAERTGKRPYQCPLFNLELGDGHLSPKGARVWAALVARRLALLLKTNHAMEPAKR
jgi:hypothetical protein